MTHVTASLISECFIAKKEMYPEPIHDLVYFDFINIAC